MKVAFRAANRKHQVDIVFIKRLIFYMFGQRAKAFFLQRGYIEGHLVVLDIMRVAIILIMLFFILCLASLTKILTA